MDKRRMSLERNKHMTQYQKLAKKKLQKFKKAYDETTLKEAHAFTTQVEKLLNNPGFDENLEMEEAENQLEGDDSTTTNSDNPENNSKSCKRRGATICKGLRTENGEKYVVDFNEKGQPIGHNSNLYSSYLGKIARERAPISFPTWHKVPLGMKNKMWIAVKQKFVVPETAKKLSLKLIGKDWRGYKVNLRKKYVYVHDSDEDKIKACPENVKVDDWKAFIAYTSREEFKRLRQRGKEAVKHHILPHTCSRKGYARLEDDMRRANNSGLPITRGEVWKKAHKNKNGEPVNEIAKEKIEKLEETNSSVPCGKDDALSQVLGPDPNGRVRGVGYGVTASTLFGVNQCVGLVNSLEARCKKLEAELSSVHKVLAKLNVQPSDSSQPSNEDQLEQVNSTQQDNQNVTTGGVSSNGGDTPKAVYCKLFRLVPEDIVAEGYWFTDDPNALVHHQPLGPGFSKVSIVVAKQMNVLLARKTDAMETIDDAVGSFVAWPTRAIIKG